MVHSFKLNIACLSAQGILQCILDCNKVWPENILAADLRDIGITKGSKNELIGSGCSMKMSFAQLIDICTFYAGKTADSLPFQQKQAIR
jgi:hypothetical protein